MIRKLPKNGYIRCKRAFAWLPVKTDDGYHLWFGYYTRVEYYWGYKNKWYYINAYREVETNDH